MMSRLPLAWASAPPSASFKHVSYHLLLLSSCPNRFAIDSNINSALDVNKSDHSCRVAVSDLFSIGVTGVRPYLKTIYPRILFAASAIGRRRRISDASGTTARVTI